MKFLIAKAPKTKNLEIVRFDDKSNVIDWENIKELCARDYEFLGVIETSYHDPAELKKAFNSKPDRTIYKLEDFINYYNKVKERIKKR